MKKALVFLLIIAFAFSIVACSATDSSSGSSGDNKETVQDTPAADAKTEFKIGETWAVDGQWEVTVTGITETSERNEYSDKKPAAVYIVSFTWKNIGYEDKSGIMDGLYFTMDSSVIDSTGLMGYSYPGSITDYPQETPVGATSKGQVCIGVDNKGLPIKMNVTQYDSNSTLQKATFILE